MKYFYKHCFNPAVILFLLLAWSGEAHSQISRRYKIIDLGTFGAECYAAAVNNKGHVAGTSRASGPSPWQAFIWQDGVMTSLGSLSGNGSSASAINDRDEVTGNSDVNPQPDDEGGFNYDRGAFFWRDGSMSDIGHLGGHASWASDINNLGIVVGSSLRPDSLVINAYIWNGSIQDLGVDENWRSEAWGINNLGQIIGWKYIPGGWEGWLMDGGLTILGEGMVPYDINDRGEIIGRSQSGPFLWQNGNLTYLATPANSAANSINSSGEIVGSPAFIYKDGQVKYLDSLIGPGTGWDLVEATGINDSGLIVGNGFHNGQPRAFILIPELKITRPESNMRWIAGEKDTIRWSGGEHDEILEIDYSLDSGKTFNILDYIGNADTGVYVWDIPADILSKKCMIRIMLYNRPTIADTSDLFKIKPYILTRDSAGQYEPFRPEEDRWGFWNNQPDMWPSAWYQQFDYQGTDPFTGSQYSQWQGGFVFASAISAEHPDWVSFVNSVGVDECYVSETLGIYSPSALQWWNAVKRQWRGSCFGIAISSAAAFSHKNQFQARYGSFPAFGNPIGVTSDDGVKKTVNELFAHQFVNPHYGYQSSVGVMKTPTETLNDLKNMCVEDVGEVRTLDFLNNGPGGGGHSILAYGVDKDPIVPDVFYLKVYDNSYPTSNNRIWINTAANGGDGSWYHPDWPGWGGSKWIYQREPTFTHLTGPAASKRTVRQSSFILGETGLQVFNAASASTRIIDSSGNITGFYNDSVQTDIPGSAPSILLNGSETPPYGYSLPMGHYSVVIDSFTGGNVSTSFFNGNKTFSYGRDSAEQDQTDRLFFDGGLSAVNPDALVKTVSLLNIINESAQEKLFAFRSITLLQNDSVKIQNPDSNSIRLISFGTAKEYDIELNYVTGTGIGRFGDFNVPLPANSSHTIVPDWAGVTNTGLKILIDEGNDGTIDDTLSLINHLTGVGNDHGSGMPSEYMLHQNYPNPFNPATTIRYELPQASHITLKVYDLLGQVVATLVDGLETAGDKSAEWNATDVPSGVYYYRLEAGGVVQTKKMILMR